MIKFRLACDKGHEFDSWFPDGASFETQTQRGLVICPQCDSRRVSKALMAPALVGARAQGDDGDARPVALLDDRSRELREAIMELQRRVEAATDDVGERFPEIARAIHFGEEPDRPIRGKASLAAAKDLLDEGVGVLPLPVLPDEAN